MAKFSTTLLILALLVFSTTLIYAARPLPAHHHHHHHHHENVKMEDIKVDETESCEGVNEEECLMRRTLVAHTDYIYTQQQNP